MIYHKIALIAIVLLFAGCSSKGNWGRCTVPFDVETCMFELEPFLRCMTPLGESGLREHREFSYDPSSGSFEFNAMAVSNYSPALIKGWIRLPLEVKMKALGEDETEIFVRPSRHLLLLTQLTAPNDYTGPFETEWPEWRIKGQYKSGLQSGEWTYENGEYLFILDFHDGIPNERRICSTLYGTEEIEYLERFYPYDLKSCGWTIPPVNSEAWDCEHSANSLSTYAGGIACWTKQE